MTEEFFTTPDPLPYPASTLPPRAYGGHCTMVCCRPGYRGTRLMLTRTNKSTRGQPSVPMIVPHVHLS
eukprot:763071-Hanusia_phi.AAC.2